MLICSFGDSTDKLERIWDVLKGWTPKSMYYCYNSLKVYKDSTEFKGNPHLSYLGVDVGGNARGWNIQLLSGEG